MSVDNTITENNGNDSKELPGGDAAALQPAAYAYPYYARQTTARKVKPAFKPTMIDFVFALVVFALGYLFSRRVFFTWQGWGVTLFTALYLLTVTAYLIRKEVFAGNAASWFWLGITMAAGVSYALWENRGFTGIRALFLFCSAVYYVLTASGLAVMGKTGNYLLIDGLNAVILIPFRNFLNQYISFGALKRGDKKGKGLAVFLGILLAVFLLICIIPMLRRADSGGFSVILDYIADVFSFNFGIVLFYFVFSIPIAAYIYGLVSGAAHKRAADTIKPEGAEKAVAALRFFQPATIHIMLGAVCGLYIVFIACQVPYFFSAFTGRRPEGWLIYAEYARQGFFELCGIAALNLVILTAGNVTSKKRRADSRLLKAFNIGLAVITLVLIATAFSKMALYINVYGLTMPRLLPCVFMVFMAIVFVALIALQKWDFSIVRFSLVAGAMILCLLCLTDPDALVVRYNTNRYLRGTLPSYDMEIVRRAGDAGVIPAIEVYERTADVELRNQLSMYLSVHLEWIDYRTENGLGSGANTLSLETYRARERLRQTVFWK